MMEGSLIESDIKLKTKKDVLRLHFYAKLLERQIPAYPSDIEILTELYSRNGYHSKKEMEELYDYCVDNKLKGPLQSFYNTMTKFVNNGVLIKHGKHQRSINPEIVPPTNTPFLALNYRVINETTD